MPMSYAVSSSTETSTQFDIKVLDESGQVVVAINNFIVRALAKEKESVAYYERVWEEKVFVPGEAVTGPLLVWDTQGELTEAVRSRYPAEQVIQVKAGKQYVANEQIYQINLTVENDYHTTIKRSCKTQAISEANSVCTVCQPLIYRTQNIKAQLTAHYYSLFNLSKALLETKMTAPLSLLCINVGR